MVLRASWAMHGLVNGLVHGSMVTGGVDMVAGKVVCWGSGVVCNETDSMLSNPPLRVVMTPPRGPRL